MYKLNVSYERNFKGYVFKNTIVNLWLLSLLTLMIISIT